MSMNPVPRDTDDESKKAIEEFLAKGGKIQYFDYGKRSEEIDYKGGSFYGKKKKKADTEE